MQTIFIHKHPGNYTQKPSAPFKKSKTALAFGNKQISNPYYHDPHFYTI